MIDRYGWIDLERGREKEIDKKNEKLGEIYINILHSEWKRRRERSTDSKEDWGWERERKQERDQAILWGRRKRLKSGDRKKP